MCRILKNLKGTISVGVLYRRRSNLDLDVESFWIQTRQDPQLTKGPLVCIVPQLLRSKKHNVVARSGVEAEYKAMEHTVCELMWIQKLLQELGISFEKHIAIYCNNQVAIHIANNPIFHQRTKHIEMDYHFMSKKAITPYIKSKDQLCNVFTKGLSSYLVKGTSIFFFKGD